MCERLHVRLSAWLHAFFSTLLSNGFNADREELEKNREKKILSKTSSTNFYYNIEFVI
jgi:hypothetical protein